MKVCRNASILFADIVGFSKLREGQQGRSCAVLRALAEDRFLDLVEASRCVVKLTGDGLLVVQLESANLHSFAVALQHDGAAHGFELRQGINTGLVRIVSGLGGGNDAVGHAVNTCQRIMALGEPNHILLGEAYVGGVTGVGHRHVHDLGVRQVKHDQDVHVYNYYGSRGGVRFGNPSDPARIPWRLPANGVGISLGCDELEVYPSRTAGDFPYTPPWLERELANGWRGKVTVVARTARSWTQQLSRLKPFLAGRHPSLELDVVIADPLVDASVLAVEERPEFFRTLRQALNASQEEALTRIPGLQFLFSPVMVLESVTLVELWRGKHSQRQAVLDLYTGSLHADRRPCVVVKHDEDRKESDCLVKRLVGRTERLAGAAGKDMPSDRMDSDLEALLDPTGEPSRNNAATCLLPTAVQVFDFYQYVEPFLAADARQLVEPIPVPPPLCVQIEITNACNVTGCLGCSRAKGNGVREMSPKVFDDLVASLARMGTRNVVLSGGEPLIHSKAAEILKSARRSGMNVAVLTDGLALVADEELVDVVVRCVSSLRVSMDGIDPTVYGAVRWLPKRHPCRRDPAAAIAEALRLVAARRHQASDVRLQHVGICTTLFSRNADEVESVFGWARSQPVQSLVLKFAHGTPSSIGRRQRKFVCSVAAVRRVQSALRRIRRRQQGHLEVNESYVLDFVRRMGPENIAAGTPTRQLYEDEQLVCFIPLLFAMVDPAGNVYRCCHCFFDNSWAHQRRRDCREGSLKRKLFHEIWTDSAYARIRKSNSWDSGGKRIVCDCPTMGECTRHWTQNMALTPLFNTFQQASLSSRAELLAKVRAQIEEDPPPDQFWL